jgi:hypothetical protein
VKVNEEGNATYGRIKQRTSIIVRLEKDHGRKKAKHIIIVRLEKENNQSAVALALYITHGQLELDI